MNWPLLHPDAIQDRTVVRAECAKSHSTGYAAKLTLRPSSEVISAWSSKSS